MQLGLDETLRDAEHRFKGIISEFEANVRTVERNAGKILAEHVKDYTAAMRQGLHGRHRNGRHESPGTRGACQSGAGVSEQDLLGFHRTAFCVRFLSLHS
jgi:hypothetical protein